MPLPLRVASAPPDSGVDQESLPKPRLALVASPDLALDDDTTPEPRASDSSGVRLVEGDAVRAAMTTEPDFGPCFEVADEPRAPMPTLEESHEELRRRHDDVIERRKHATHLAAAILGVAWMVCQLACVRGIVQAIW